MAKKISPKDRIKETVDQKEIVSNSEIGGWFGILVTVIFIFLLTLAGSMDNIVEKWSGLASAAIILILLLATKKSSAALKEYITPLFFSFTAYIVWGGISTLYAASGKFAIFEFSKLLVALFIYIAVLCYTNPDHAGFRFVAVVIASIGSFFGVISVDAASSGFLSGLFKAVFGIFTSNFAESGAFEQGIRISGIFGNPNTYAGFMALAVLLSLYLVRSSSGRNERIVSISLLAINSLSYLLAFSIGSLFMFLIACLVMIASSVKGERISVFLLMLETSVLTFIFAFIAVLGLGKTGPVSFLPLLALILNAAVLYQFDIRFRTPASIKLNSDTKLLISTVAIIAVLITGYSTAAFFLSGNLELSANESITRGIYIPSGTYNLSVESSAPVDVKIESQNNYDLMRHTSTTLYAGTNEEVMTINVPKNSKIVLVSVSSSTGDIQVTKAEYSGTESGSIHLNYPLLPEIFANRIQNLFANENMVQRTIFFQDGLKLFEKSPVIGRGLGGFENGVYSVQDFFYETKYTHNHYIQVLCDLGIIGFAFFISIMIFSAISVVSSRRNSRSSFAVPVLAACVVQMFGQALTDATWSTGVFLGFSAAILGLITIFCAEPLKRNGSFAGNRLPIIEKVFFAVFTGIFVLLLSGNLYAQAQAKAGVDDFDDIERLITIDKFESNDYKLSYIINAPKANSEEILKQAQLYADQLAKVESNSLTPYVMDLKFKVYNDSDAYDIAKQGLKNNRSNPMMWSKVFDVLEENVDPVGPNVNDAADRLKNGQYYIDGVVELYNLLVERNKNSLDAITLTPANNAFIGKCLEIQSTHLYNVDWVFTAIMTYAFDSTSAVDANQDGIPDSMTILSGNVTKAEMNRLNVTENTRIEFALYHKLHGTYRFNIETMIPQQGLTITLNGTPQTVQYDEEDAYVEIALEDNSSRALSTFDVTFPAAAKIKSITFTTKLEQ